MRQSTPRRRRTERGASAVEFALVVLPLLAIVFAIVNFAVVFAQQLALDNAIRAGARAGVVDTGRVPGTVATTEFENTALARSLAGSVTVTYPGAVGSTCKGSAFGQSLVVRGTVSTTFLLPWPLPDSVMPQTLNLSSQAEFQCEYQ